MEKFEETELLKLNLLFTEANMLKSQQENCSLRAIQINQLIEKNKTEANGYMEDLKIKYNINSTDTFDLKTGEIKRFKKDDSCKPTTETD